MKAGLRGTRAVHVQLEPSSGDDCEIVPSRRSPACSFEADAAPDADPLKVPPAQGTAAGSERVLGSFVVAEGRPLVVCVAIGLVETSELLLPQPPPLLRVTLTLLCRRQVTVHASALLLLSSPKGDWEKTGSRAASASKRSKHSAFNSSGICRVLCKRSRTVV